MHIPDGFIAPVVYLPATGLAVLAWSGSARSLAPDLRRAPENLPRLAMLTALCYALGLVMLPLPGGTSAHPLGIAALTLLFGARAAFVAYGLVLLMQSLLFGAGGITALGVNALCIGLIGAGVARSVFVALRRWHEAAAVTLAGALAVLAAATATALVLGSQPLLAQDTGGAPRYFPFGISVTLPALLLPHALLALAEAALTLALWRHAKRRRWVT